MSRRRTAFAVLLALLVVLGASGCAAISTEGPVTAGRSLEQDPREGLVGYVPNGPGVGDSPTSIVRGFVTAGTAFSDNHEVARTFLAAPLSTTWRADVSVQIYDDALTPAVQLTALDGHPTDARKVSDAQLSDAQQASVRLSVRRSAAIDSTGLYTEAVAGTVATMKFTLQRVQGEWRISQAPNGVLLSALEFGTTFRSFPLWFPDGQHAYLVPDVRWFPVTSALSTTLVRALLAGPAPWLEPAVRSGFPSGTRLAVSAVPTTGDTATVDLTESALSATPADRLAMQQQLEATLNQVPTVAKVQMTVGQAPFDPSGDTSRATNPAGEPAGQLQRTPYATTTPVYVTADGTLSWLGGRSLSSSDGVAGLDVAGAQLPAAAVDGTAFAVLTGGRSRLLYQRAGSARAQTLLSGANLTAPSFDVWGWVWSTPRNGGDAVQAVHPDGTVQRVQAPWLDQLSVLALRVSRDGTRVVVAVQGRTGVRVLVAAIQRAKDATPVRLGDPVRVVPDLQSVQDVGWAGPQTVVVLGRRDGQSAQPWLAEVGGTVRGTLNVDDAVSVTASAGGTIMYVGTADGRILSRSGGWLEVGKGSDPALPG